VAAGDGAAVGAATTSISTTISILIAIQISAGATARRTICRVEVETAVTLAGETGVNPTGNTTRNIVVALRIEIGRPRTDLAAQPAETLWPTVRLARGNSLASREAIWPATGVEEAVLAAGPEEALV
jgi:hypothetical protein